jgi:hypothetical protein
LSDASRSSWTVSPGTKLESPAGAVSVGGESLAGDPDVAFVTKPWTASELLRQIRSLLER